MKTEHPTATITVRDAAGNLHRSLPVDFRDNDARASAYALIRWAVANGYSVAIEPASDDA